MTRVRHRLVLQKPRLEMSSNHVEESLPRVTSWLFRDLSIPVLTCILDPKALNGSVDRRYRDSSLGTVHRISVGANVGRPDLATDTNENEYIAPAQGEHIFSSRPNHSLSAVSRKLHQSLFAPFLFPVFTLPRRFP